MTDSWLLRLVNAWRGNGHRLLGGGVIVKDKFSVRGLATASTL